jgi:hypothetical protein
MPIEIRELHIKVTVNQPQQASGKQSGEAAGKQSSPEAKDELVRHCIDEVLSIVTLKKER